MAVSLSGFPAGGIQLTLGSKWVNTVNSLTSASALTLTPTTDTSSQYKASEAGSTTPNRTTNRFAMLVTAIDNSSGSDFIKTRFLGPDGTSASNITNIFATTGSSNTGVKKMASVQHFGGTANETYTFLTTPNKWVSSTSGGASVLAMATAWFGASASSQYNGLFFSSFAAAGGGGGPAAEINVVSAKDSTSIADAEADTSVDDGTNFGIVRKHDTEADPTATFNIENLGAGDLTITSITVPTGFEIHSSGDLDGTSDTIGSFNSKTLVVSLDRSAAAGYKAGNVTITNSDSDEGTYTFAVAGNVATETVGGGLVSSGQNPAVLKTSTPCKKVSVNNPHATVSCKVHIPGVHKTGEFATIEGGENITFERAGDNIDEVFGQNVGSASTTCSFTINNLGQ